MADDKKTITPVAKGVRAKRSGFQKVFDMFISEDLGTIKDFIVKEVLVPTIKKSVCDTVVNATNILLYGQKASINNNILGRSNVPASYVAYSSVSSAQNVQPQPGRYSLDDIVMNTHQEAEDVLRGMSDILQAYPSVSVAEFYELCGTTGSYTDNNYGWTSIAQAEIIRTKNGYIVKLPKPRPIK